MNLKVAMNSVASLSASAFGYGQGATEHEPLLGLTREDSPLRVNSHVLCAAIIVLGIFYVRFLLESGTELENAKEFMTSMTTDHTEKIRRRMAEVELADERIHSWKRAGTVASDVSQKLSPTHFLWGWIVTVYDAIHWVQMYVLRSFSSAVDLLSVRLFGSRVLAF